MPGPKKQSRQTIGHGIRQPANPTCDNASTGGHRLNRRDAQGILCNRRNEHDIGRAVMPGQLSLRAPADRPGDIVNLTWRVKRNNQLEIRPSFPKNPARLMSDMKPLDRLAGDSGHEQRRHRFCAWPRLSVVALNRDPAFGFGAVRVNSAWTIPRFSRAVGQSLPASSTVRQDSHASASFPSIAAMTARSFPTNVCGHAASVLAAARPEPSVYSGALIFVLVHLPVPARRPSSHWMAGTAFSGPPSALAAKRRASWPPVWTSLLARFA